MGSNEVTRTNSPWRLRPTETVVYALAFGLTVWSVLNQLYVGWFDDGVIGLLEGHPSNLAPSDMARLQGAIPAGVAILGMCLTFYFVGRFMSFALDRLSDRPETPEEAAFWSVDSPESVEPALPPDKPQP